MPATPSTAGALLADYPEITDRSISIIRPAFQIGPDPVQQGWPPISAGDHEAYMRYALALARLSPPNPTSLCVGGVLVDTRNGAILSTGYTLELEGKTHASQNAISKFLAFHKVSNTGRGSMAVKNFMEDMQSRGMTHKMDIYTTLEPCCKRLSGNVSCVSRILGIRGLINKVYVGVKGPSIYVSESSEYRGSETLERQGLDVIQIKGMEEEILEVAKAGHVNGGDRSVVLRKVTGENEELEIMNSELEEENEEVSERAEEIAGEWRQSVKTKLKDPEDAQISDLDSEDEDWEYDQFVKDPVEEVEELRGVIKRLKAENRMLWEKVGKSAEEKERDALERAREENVRLKIVNEELGKENNRLKRREHRLVERYC